MKPAAGPSGVSPAVIAAVTDEELRYLFAVPAVFDKETYTVTISLPNDERAHELYEELLDDVLFEDQIRWLRRDLEVRGSRAPWRSQSHAVFSDDQLYRRFAGGDDRAFEELVARWIEPLERWSRMAFRHLESDEVVQATLFELYRTAPHVQQHEADPDPSPRPGPGPGEWFNSWIRRLLQAVGERLTRKKERFLSNEPPPERAFEVDYDTRISIHEVLDHMSPEQQNAVESFFQGKTLAEVAREEHVSRRLAAERRQAGVETIIKELHLDRK